MTSNAARHRRPKIHLAHGHRRVDEHYWLRDRDDPEVLAWLEAENRRTGEAGAAWRASYDELLEDMRKRIVPNESSVPYREGSYLYYARYRDAAEYPLYCRRRASGGDEELLLDVAALADGHEHYSVGAFSVAPDECHAAFAVDTVGDGVYTIHFLDLRDGSVAARPVADATDTFEWAADSRSLLYTRQDPETRRDFQVWRRLRGSDNDRLVYHEADESCWLSVERSLSARHLYICSAATLSTEVLVLPADRPDADPVSFLERRDGHEYYVTDGGDRFFILSNDEAMNFRLFDCPLEDTRRSRWREVVPHRDDVLIHGVEVFEKYLVLSVSADGLDEIEVIDRSDGTVRRIEFGESVYAAGPVDNCVYQARTVRYAVESPTTPERIIDHDLASGAEVLVRQEPVGGGFEPGDYRSERRWVTVRDGTSVPVSLVWKKSTEHGPDTPLLMEAYGAYGICSEPQFDSDLLSLLDRGFVCAIAHVRGGSELGRGWYHAGRRHRKMNTFLDFVDVTRGLHGAGLSSPPHTYGTGGSAGGLVVGAVANIAPGLFNGLCARVPFVDIVTTMLDETIPLTTGEYDEWGDPRDRKSYFYMLGYSPYDNVRAQDYPHLLVTTSLNDSLVQFWEPAKWVARLRERKTDDNLLLLKTDLNAGHVGKTGRYQSLEDTALEYAFFLMLEKRGSHKR